MQNNPLNNFFEDYLNKKPLFKDKSFLQTTYCPETITHREKELNKVANILAPSLRLDKPSNLFIYGKTGCIAGDSLVYTNNGWKKIKDVKENQDLVYSYNIKKDSYELSKFKFLKFKNKDALLKITLDNGYELIVTKDHPLLLSKMSWEKSDQLAVGQELVISYNLPSNINGTSPTMARLLGFMLSEGSLNVRKRRVEHHRGGFYNSNRQRCRFFSEDKELLDLVKNDLRTLFSCTPREIIPKNRCTHINVISKEVCTALNNLGVPFGKKSEIIQVPKTILESSSFCQREFLKALFSGDGTVSQHTYMIEYYSNSLKLLQGMSYLLHQEGILCKIRAKKAKCNGKEFSSFRLYISGQENLVKFYHKIGFYAIKKQNKLQKMLCKYVKNMGFKDKNHATSKIVKIEEACEEHVYDLTVPNNHNFIANGIISHNTGKTLVVKHTINQLSKFAEQKQIKLKTIYLNCKLKKIADTEYRLIAQLLRYLGEDIPSTGLPTEEVYKKFYNSIDNEKQIIIVALDEIDQLVSKIGDELLYNLTRINEELNLAQISFVGISNDLFFIDTLDPRVRSSLSEEEVVFPPYNALQIKDILKQRADKAFNDGCLTQGVIEKCAAFAAREHGDARRALQLLRVAAEIAERKNLEKVEISHLDKAEKKIEYDRILDLVNNQPKQSQLVLYSIIKIFEQKNNGIFTGEVYNLYQQFCSRLGFSILTQRRVSDIIAELDMLGIINSRVLSKGRYGRSREISIMLPQDTLNKVNTLLNDGFE